jgi:broad-specificity NMP kinase
MNEIEKKYEFVLNKMKAEGEIFNSEELVVSIKDLLYDFLLDDIKGGKRYKNGIQSFEEIKIDEPTILTNQFVDYKGNILIHEKTGLFKITFKNREFLYVYKYMPRSSKNDRVETLFIGTEKVIGQFDNIRLKEMMRRQKPPKGIFNAHYNEDYEKVSYLTIPISHFPKIDVFHPSYEILYEDVNNFFSNEDGLYKRLNKPKIKKVMLIGEPGTGKTLMIYNLIRLYYKSYHISYVIDFRELMANILNIKDHSIPSIIVFEDCEKKFKDVNNFVLNFLDGIYQPMVKKGMYIIFTTNSPVGIEDRIMKRPGRIDNIIHVGPLRENYALECAKFYFRDFFEITDDYEEIFNNLTGAQIANMVNGVKSKALKKRKINKELMQEVKKEMLNTWKDTEKYAIRNYYSNVIRGFSSDDETPF